jgi:glycosyltransferase involved in cell wall biosynthesis
MRIVFWQNCLSPHQMPYIVHLLDDTRVDEVAVVTDEIIGTGREKMGWERTLPHMGNGFAVFIAPDEENVDALLRYRISDSYHLFSGIRGFDSVFSVFRKSLKYRLHRGVITEAPYTFAMGISQGKPLWLHWLRYQVQDFQYLRQVEMVFAIGESAQRFFQTLNHKWTVFPFIYCTKAPKIPIVNIAGPLRVCFVGALSVRKNVMMLLKAINIPQIGQNRLQLTIFGDGPERKKLETYVVRHQLNNVVFVGTQRNDAVPIHLANQDILVLPSIHDGWGAVVNEALQQGCYVICTDSCGASALLSEHSRGCVISRKTTELTQCLLQCIGDKESLRENRAQRKQWADTHIDGGTIAHYMVDCLSRREQTSSVLPWS